MGFERKVIVKLSSFEEVIIARHRIEIGRFTQRGGCLRDTP